VRFFVQFAAVDISTDIERRAFPLR